MTRRTNVKNLKIPFGLNLPNAITIVRILMIPLILLFLLVEIPGGNMLATIIFLVASCTDGLDGYYARSLKQVTNLGKFLDPLADKLLIIAALCSLVALDRVGVVAVIIIIARELMVTGLRAIAASAGVVVAASSLGKLKTVSQIIAVTYILLAGTFIVLPLWLGTVLIWVAVALTLLSGYDYFEKCRKLF